MGPFDCGTDGDTQLGCCTITAPKAVVDAYQNARNRRRRGEVLGEVMTFDLPGHGEACGTSALGAKEVDGLLDLLAQLDNHSYLLVGNSMGSVIAFAAASRPEPIAKRVRGVIAYGAYIKFHQSLVG